MSDQYDDINSKFSSMMGGESGGSSLRDPTQPNKPTPYGGSPPM